MYLPYLVIGLAATNLGEAWRLAEGKELGDKIMSMMGTVPLAFASPLPSLHPLDFLVGLCCGAGLRLAVYLRGKNASFHQAADIWNRIQPYLWERALIKQDWIQE